MIEYKRATSLGGAYILIKSDVATKWLGATFDGSTQYDRLVEDILGKIDNSDKYNIVESVIDDINLLVFVNSSNFFKINDNNFIQIEAVTSSERNMTNNSFDILNNLQPITTKRYDVLLNKGKYYLYDSAWEFLEIQEDDNLLEINLTNDVSNILVGYYKTEEFDGWHIILE